MSFVIKSDTSATILRFLESEGEFLIAEIQSLAFSGTIRFSTYTDHLGLRKFFREMAKQWRGWKGEKHWESLEGDFRIAAQTDLLGHISLSVKLTDDFGKPEPWSLSVTMQITAGQLENLAHQAILFFSGRKID